MRSAYFPWSGHGWVQSSDRQDPPLQKPLPHTLANPFLASTCLRAANPQGAGVCACVYMYICKCACVSCLRVQISQSTAANTVGDSGCLDVPQ